MSNFLRPEIRPMPMGKSIADQWRVSANGEELQNMLNVNYILNNGSQEEKEALIKNPHAFDGKKLVDISYVEIVNEKFGRQVLLHSATGTTNDQTFPNLELYEKDGGGDVVVLGCELPNKNTNKLEWHVSVVIMRRALQDNIPVLDLARSYRLDSEQSTLTTALERMMSGKLETNKLYRVGRSINTNNANVNTIFSSEDCGIRVWFGHITQDMIELKGNEYKLLDGISADANFPLGVKKTVFIPLRNAMRRLTTITKNKRPTNGMALNALTFVKQHLRTLNRKQNVKESKG